MWNRKEIKRRGKRQFLRNWWATVAVCFLLAFAGAEFTDSVSFVRELDLSALPGSEPVAMESTQLSNWDLLLKWLDVDLAEGAHPLWLAADRSVQPVFEMLTQTFSAFLPFWTVPSSPAGPGCPWPSSVCWGESGSPSG